MAVPETVELPTIKRRIPVPFFIAVPANSNVGLSSDMVNFPFKVVKVEAHFTDDAQNNLQIWAFVSTNRNVTTTAPMPDNKLLGFFSPTPYLIGSGEVVAVDVDVTPAENEKFIKAYFANTNAYQVYGYCIITIESLAEIPEGIVIAPSGTDERTYTYEEWLGIMDKKGHAFVDQYREMISGTQAWLPINSIAVSRVQGETVDIWRAEANKLATMTSYFKPNMHIDDFLLALQAWFADSNELMKKYSMGNIAGEIAGLGTINFTRDLIKRDEETWQIPQEMGKINTITYDASINKFAEYSANWYFQAQIPDVNNLMNMVVKEKITLDYFKEQMRKQGFTNNWSQLIWDAHFIAPDYDSVKRAYWRGAITEGEIDDFMKRVDLDPYYNDKVWRPLLTEIPPYQELVNQRVKEVIPQGVFEEALGFWGFKGEWADRIWDAHFNPANFTDFLTAMRRQETVNIPVAEGAPETHTFGEDPNSDIETIKRLSILADYDPRYWDFFKTRMYNDPTPRLARWAFETGDVDPERIKEIVHRFGYYPQDEEWISDMFIHFQERPWVTRYLTALASAYIAEAITAEELKTRVKAIPRNEAIADWMVKIADVRKEIMSKGGKAETGKLLSITDLKKAYSLDKINEDTFRTELQLRGYEEKDIITLLEIMNFEKEAEDRGGVKRGLTIAEYINAWRYGELSESQLRTELQLKGLTLTEIDLLINTKKKQWGMLEPSGGESS